MNKQIESGYWEKVQKVDEECFVTPDVTTVKQEKEVKIALDSRNLNDSCIKLKPYVPNFEAVLNQMSTEIIRVQNEPLWISKIDLEYAYDQPKLSGETRKHCNSAKKRGKFNGFCGLKKISTVYPIYRQ